MSRWATPPAWASASTTRQPATSDWSPAGLAAATGESVRVRNLSVSGARARDVVDRQLPRLARLPAPDLVTCVVGGNDVAWARRFDAESFARDMDVIAQGLPLGSTMGLVPHFVHWPYEGRARKANEAIRVAAHRHGPLVADLHTTTSELPLRRYLGTFAPDWFHPNETGHALWADTIWEQVAAGTA